VLKYDKVIPLRRVKNAALVKGYYKSEEPLVNAIKEHVGPPGDGGAFKTIECQIMDIADDIAYSTYDLEDAMKGGFAHPLQLLTRISDQTLFAKLYAKVAQEVKDATREDVFGALTDLLMLNGNAKSDGTQQLQQYTESMLIATDGKMRSEFSSTLVGTFIRGVSVQKDRKGQLKFGKIDVARDIRLKIESLKHLNFLLTIMSPRLKVVEYRGYDVVKTIFEVLDSDEGHLLLPDDLQKMHERMTDTDSRKRLICDFVAGMTDRYAVEFYSRLRESGPTIFKPI
jgi:dGTPase